MLAHNADAERFFVRASQLYNPRSGERFLHPAKEPDEQATDAQVREAIEAIEGAER